MHLRHEVSHHTRAPSDRACVRFLYGLLFKGVFSLWAGRKFLGPALRVGSSQRVEHVALSHVCECLGACVSVRQGDAAGHEGTYGARPGDGKGPEPPFVGATRVCGDLVVSPDVGYRLGVAAGEALEKLVGFGVEQSEGVQGER